jgi:hypothetical protein
LGGYGERHRVAGHGTERATDSESNHDYQLSLTGAVAAPMRARFLDFSF